MLSKQSLLVLTPNLGTPIIAVNKIQTENAWINEILQTVTMTSHLSNES